MTATRRDERADNPDHDDIEITFAMRRATNGEERHDSTIMRQAVEGTGDNCTHPVHQRGIYACSAAMRI